MRSNSDGGVAFLVYLSRSGSTLIGDRLDIHPDVVVLPESRMVPWTFGWFERNGPVGRREAREDLASHLLTDRKLLDWDVDADLLRRAVEGAEPFDWPGVVGALCDVYRTAVKPEARVAVIKKGGWSNWHIGLQLREFAGSKVIAVVRDPRAVYASGRKAVHSETGRRLSRNPVRTARLWARFVEAVERERGTAPERVRLVSYDETVRRFAPSIRGTWEFLGVDPLAVDTDRILTGGRETSRLVTGRTAHLHENIAEPPDPSRIDAWEKSLSVWERVVIRLICHRAGRRIGCWT